jgi:hypothetical protein
MRKLYTIAAAMTCFGSLWAAPSLVTIQDILYKADGTRFNGTLNIQWNNFQAGDASIVATQAVTVQIVNGVLKVQLVPTTNASSGANYLVNYASAGKFQFTETWAVPPSATTLRVRDVRVSNGTTVGPTGGVTGSSLQIADVSGLNNELLLRIMRGVAFTPGRTAVINSAGQIDAAAGNLSDCVRVDGSSAPCGSSGGSGGTAFVDAEIPTGLVNSANALFTLSFAPSPAASLALFRNGLLMRQGVDYVLNGVNITFYVTSLPQTGDLLTASYRYTFTPAITAGGITSQNTPEVLCNGTGALTTSTSQVTLATCHIPANTLIAGDRIEIKFGYLHLGTTATSAPVMSWGGTTLLTRGMNSSDLALYGESSVLVANDGTLQHYTGSQISGGLPLVTAGTVTDNIQNVNTLTLNGSIGTPSGADSLALRYYIVTRYPAQ